MKREGEKGEKHAVKPVKEFGWCRGLIQRGAMKTKNSVHRDGFLG